jgi:hypothetical protein
MTDDLGVWSIIVEFTFPVEPEDVVEHDGDSEADFAKRAVRRLKPRLDAMTDSGRKISYLILNQNLAGEVRSDRSSFRVPARRCAR